MDITTYVLENDRCRIKIFYRSRQREGGQENMCYRTFPLEMRVRGRGTGLSEFKSPCHLLWKTGPLPGALSLRVRVILWIDMALSCPWAGLPRATGYSPNYMNYLLPSGCAISFYLDQLVSTRVSKFTYDFFIHIAYDSSNPDHQHCSQNAFTSASGLGGFSQPKVTCLFPFLVQTWVSYLKTFRISEFWRRRNPEDLITGL